MDTAGSHPFRLDDFQQRAIAALDDGRHVVVAAPTGSGKTVVAEHGIERARSQQRRSFYTAPLKALSNQKFVDFTARYGAGEVGLLTGDTSIAGDAPTVVMTTEVLRNMIYGESPALRDLGAVVLDEVHFLQDAYRGPVWEEVIIHLPTDVQLICLSATVSNAGELAAWIETVRGPTTSIVETTRPVDLDDYYLVDDRTDERLHFLPTFVDGVPNEAAARLDQSAVRRGGPGGRRPERRPGGRRKVQGSGRRRLATPSRLDVVDVLQRHDMLPAIVFVFSRNQCDQAAATVLASGVQLTTSDQQVAIEAIIDQRLGTLSDADLEVLGVDEFRACLRAGVAAHHAGLVPAFKEVVEQCFTAGLLQVVFATETLAVGVNMPARSVVIEKLTKFTGESHQMLTPGEYTQLTGRAGRRGIDEIGHAIVLWSPWVDFWKVADLAGSTSFQLRSAFRATYNMAANLVAGHQPDEARRLLNQSFAQYQSGRDVVALEARRQRLARRRDDARRDAESEFGDIWEYRGGRGATLSADAKQRALRELRPGEVIPIDHRRTTGAVVVVATAERKAGIRLSVINAAGELLIVGADAVVGDGRSLARVNLPRQYAPKDRGYRMTVAGLLRKTKAASRSAETTAGSVLHPVEFDPELPARMKAAGQAERLERDLVRIDRQIDSHQRSIGREFDQVIDVLVGRGYVERETDAAGTNVRWELTDRGTRLRRLFHESDLLIAECLSAGLLDGLTAPDLAGMLSLFVYEHRSPEPAPPPWFSSSSARGRWLDIVDISSQLAVEEEALGIAVHRGPDPGFFAAAHGWVSGHQLATVVTDEELSGGDFVRTMRQLLDLARQVALVAGDPSTRAVAAQIAEEAQRGVLADISAVVG